MEHPAGKFKTALLALRTVQVLTSVINAVLTVIAVVRLSAIVHQLRHAPEMSDIFSESRSAASTKAAAGALVGVMVYAMIVAFASVITCTLWLVYTAKPSARARSCGGNKPACMRYSCDMGWDILWAVLWGVSLIIALAAKYPSVGAQIGNIATSLVMLGLFISTAVISGKVRRTLRATAASPLKDIEAPGAAMTHAPRAHAISKA